MVRASLSPTPHPLQLPTEPEDEDDDVREAAAVSNGAGMEADAEEEEEVQASSTTTTTDAAPGAPTTPAKAGSPKKPAGSRPTSGKKGDASSPPARAAPTPATSPVPAVAVAAVAASPVPPASPQVALAVDVGQGGAASSASGTAVTKPRLLSIMRELIGRVTSMKSELDGKYAPQAAAAAQREDGAEVERVQEAYNRDIAEGLAVMESEVQAQFGVSQEAVMEAQRDFSGDPDVLAAMGELQTLFLGETESIVVPEGMTVDLFFERFTRHVAIVDAAFQRALSEAALAPKEEREAYLQLVMMRQLESINEVATAEIGMTEPEFQACLMKVGVCGG